MCSAQTGFSISNKDEKSTAGGGFLKHKTENTAGFLKHKCLEKKGVKTMQAAAHQLKRRNSQRKMF